MQLYIYIFFAILTFVNALSACKHELDCLLPHYTYAKHAQAITLNTQKHIEPGLLFKLV